MRVLCLIDCICSAKNTLHHMQQGLGVGAGGKGDGEGGLGGGVIYFIIFFFFFFLGGGGVLGVGLGYKSVSYYYRIGVYISNTIYLQSR